MGNSSSSSGRGQHEETVDFGHLTPQGVYSGPRDYNHAIVSQLICARRLAPFYRPLEEYDESWDDEQILAARKVFLDQDGHPEQARVEPNHHANGGSRSSHTKRSSLQKEPSKPEAAIYRGAVECPICFLYYPPNINHSRCCDQAICTECFVQIKRAEPTTTHLVSEPAACPYCVQENFGVAYTPPVWRSGIGYESSSPWSDMSKGPVPSSLSTHKRRQKSFGADSPEVVTTDQIRPDWEAKLAAVRAAVTRRANRRIIMRQVGDRLIPVGITSGRVHPINPEEAQAEGNEGGGSRRSRRRQQQQQNQDLNQFLGSMGLGGQDLEELMVMEAMRLSLLDHEEQLRREAGNRNAAAAENSTTSPGAPSTSLPIQPSISNSTPSSSAPNSSTLSASSSPSSDPSHDTSTAADTVGTSAPRQPTPVPYPNPMATLQYMDDTSAAWRRRTPSPLPFTGAATASAVLGSGASPPSPGAPTLGDVPVPTITVAGGTSQGDGATSTLSADYSVPLRAKRTSSASQAGKTSDLDSFGVLPSSSTLTSSRGPSLGTPSTSTSTSASGV